MPLTTDSTFPAETVVALKLQNGARRLEIRFADAHGVEHVVALPLSAAVELSRFIADASSFMTLLKRSAETSAK